MLRSVIVGANPRRARGHAAAYTRVTKAGLVGTSARTPGAAEALADEFGIPRAFTDHVAMLEELRPDIVHLNTPPDVRLRILQDCEAAGVRGVVVEKPLAIDGEDYLELCRFARTTGMRVVVNHQLQFHPDRERLLDRVRAGALGRLRLVDASAGDIVAYQGTHTLQAATAFAGSAVRSVFAQASGGDGLAPNPARHYAPDRCLACLEFDSGLTGLFRCGAGAPRVDDPRAVKKFHHKRISVEGERGFVEWTMWGWRSRIDGHEEGGSHDYYEQDLLAQAALTDALADWVTGERADHPLALDAGLADFAVVLAIYTSALDRVPVALRDFEPRPHLIEELRAATSDSAHE